jgi:Tfp pilus assembly protein PilW
MDEQMTKHLLSSRAGFTLVEAMMAIVLFVMLFGATILVYISGTESWNANETALQVRQDLRRAITRISEDLRKAGTSSIVNVAAGGGPQATITFRTVTGIASGVATWSSNTTTYSVSGGHLLKQVGLGTPTTAATNISSVSFERESSTPDIVDVTIVGSKDSFKGRDFTVTGTFSVHLRNG